jgi:hypothetical protein
MRHPCVNTSKQAERDAADLLPGDLIAIAEWTVCGGKQPVVPMVKRDCLDPTERLVVQIGHAGVDLEILEQPQDLDGGTRQDRKRDVGMARPIGRRQRRYHRQRRGHGRDPEMAGKPSLQGADLLPHRPGVANDAPRPLEHLLALGREAVETRAALHEKNAKRVLQLHDRRRERRLRHAAHLGCMAEMLLARESD